MQVANCSGATGGREKDLQWEAAFVRQQLMRGATALAQVRARTARSKLTRTAVGYDGATWACEKGSQWKGALRKLQECPAGRGDLAHGRYTAATSACEDGAECLDARCREAQRCRGCARE